MAVRRDSSWLQCALFNVWGTDTGSFMYICRLGWKLIFVKYKYQKIFQAIFSSVSGSSFHRFPVCWRVVCTLLKLSGRTFLRIGKKVLKLEKSQNYKTAKQLGFFSKSVQKSVKRGERVLRARSVRALRREENTDCFAVYEITICHRLCFLSDVD